jgi:uncharacterized ferritin-like protein (DUF455 family)
MIASSVPASCNRLRAALAWRAWSEPDPQRKCDATQRLARLSRDPARALAAGTPADDMAAQDLQIWEDRYACIDPEQALRPGRPDRPELVHPRQVPDRGVGSPLGRAALLHAIAHIEFNAIDLALDAVWRFGPGLAEQYPDWMPDWIGVAADEARHFSMLSAELARRGHAYGDFPAHDGLWEMALRTRHDVLLRVALVPRLLEARGLDVTPRIMNRLRSAKDERGVALLEIILREEVEHVTIGNRWYQRLCAARGLDPLTIWDALAQDQGVALPVPPFNRAARLRAGFTEQELRRWEARPSL